MIAVALLLALAGIWELYVRSGAIEPLILPRPTDIATAVWEDRGLLADGLAITGQEMIVGLAAAVVLGVVVALALHLSGVLRRALWPLLLGSQTIPIVLLAPVLVNWFGYDLRPKIIVVALVCFFPIALAFADGLRGADPAPAKLLRSFSATRLQILRFAELPAALPRLFTGLRLAVGIAAIAAVLSEAVGSDASKPGLGQLSLRAIAQLETARSWAAIVVLTLFSLALFAALSLLERRLLPWARTPHPQGPAT